jgi:hypothetical protein
MSTDFVTALYQEAKQSGARYADGQGLSAALLLSFAT